MIFIFKFMVFNLNLKCFQDRFLKRNKMEDYIIESEYGMQDMVITDPNTRIETMRFNSYTGNLTIC